MTTWHRLLLGACMMVPPAVSTAQAPPAPATPATMSATQLDQAAADVLKEVHNRGADLYNRGDPAGAYRMYEGALAAVRPFLAHRPAVIKSIEDGLNETAKSDGAKIQAFRLHEVIEQVRADLKAEVARAAEMKAEAAPAPKAVEAAKPAPATEKKAPTLSGTMTAAGKPLAADVTVVSLDQALPRVFTATADAAGQFKFAEPMPAGKYTVMITGPAVPAKFTTVGTSPLTLQIADAAPTVANLNLE